MSSRLSQPKIPTQPHFYCAASEPKANLHSVVGLQQQTGHKALVLGLRKGAAPQNRIAEAIIEGA